MDRNSLKQPFTLNSPTDWRCPTCSKGLLRINKDTFSKSMRTTTQRDHPDWEPSWTEYVYSCLLECTNDHCKEVVSLNGVGGVNEGELSDGYETVQIWDDFFHPKYFEPPLRLFIVPDNCPEAISTPLQESFRLFFASPGAAANNVRIAIEELLTVLKVKRYNVVSGKKRFIPLHHRINAIPQKYLHLKELITAIKWLGNAGSHANGGKKETITIDDVLDSYEMTEHILQEIYVPKRKQLIALAKKVNKVKGPVR